MFTCHWFFGEKSSIAIYAQLLTTNNIIYSFLFNFDIMELMNSSKIWSRSFTTSKITLFLTKYNTRYVTT